MVVAGVEMSSAFLDCAIGLAFALGGAGAYSVLLGMVAGESLNHEGRTFIVESMDRNRIARVKILNAQRAEAGPEPSGASPSTEAGTPTKTRAIS